MAIGNRFRTGPAVFALAFFSAAAPANAQIIDVYTVDLQPDSTRINWPTNTLDMTYTYEPALRANTPAFSYIAKGGGSVAFSSAQKGKVSAQFSQPGLYKIIITMTWSPGIGPDVVREDTSTVEVWLAPVFTLQPADQTVTSPSAATFRVGVNAYPTPTFQWQKDGHDLLGANSPTYNTPGTMPSDNGSKYRCVVQNSAGSATSNVAVLTVEYAPIISTQPQSQTVTTPNGASFSVVASANPNTLVYQWKRNGIDITGANEADYVVNPALPADNNAVFSVAVLNATGSTLSNDATLKVQYKPKITTQPNSVSVTAPAAASFTVAADGNPSLFSITWQKTLGGFTTNFVGGTTFTIDPTSTADNGSLMRAIVANTIGADTSAYATLSVNAPPSPATILTDPQSTTVTAPQGASFSSTATGNPTPTLQWQRLGADWTNIPNATSSTYSLASTSASDNGAKFRMIATNNLGNGPVRDTSVAALLTVYYPPVISAHPASTTVTAPGKGVFTVSVGSANPPAAYQWQKNTSGTWSNIPGATSATDTTAATTSADNGTQYRCVVSNQAGSVTSNPATLTVQYGPSITTQPQNQTAVDGSSATFTVATVGNPAPTYQWMRGGVNINGATQPSYTTGVLGMADSGAVFSVKASNGVGTPATSGNAVLTVNRRAPAITTEPSNASVNEGQTASFSVAATGTAPLGYQWRKNGTDISGASGPSYTTPATVPADSGNAFTCVVSNPAGADTSLAAVLSVHRVITAPAITNTNLTATGTVGVAFSYPITATGTAPITFGASPLPQGVSVNTATGVISGTPTQTGGTSVTLSAVNQAGSAPTKTLSLTVSAAPVAPVINSPLTATGTLGVAFSYTVTAAGTQPITFGASPLPPGLLFDATSGVISGTPTQTGTTSVTLTASNTAGSAPAKSLSLTVNPAPAAPRITTDLPDSLVVTEKQKATFTVVATGVPAPTYVWQYQAGGGWNTVGTNSPAYSIDSATLTSAGTYRVIAGNGVSPADTSKHCRLVVKPAPVSPAITTQPASLTVLVGQRAVFRVTASGTAPLAYQWQKDTANVSGTGDSLVFPSATTSQAGQYRVRVTNAAGGATSAFATLAVNLPKVAKPQAAPAGTSFSSSISITLSCDTVGAVIRYTLDGTDPTAASTAYSAPISLSSSKTLKARAFKTGLNPSDILSEVYNYTPPGKTAKPVYAPPDTNFTGSVSVSLTSTSPAPSIYYTLDGTAPGTGSAKYSAPFSLYQTTPVRAFAVSSGLTPSDTLAVTFRMSTPPSKVAAPKATPAGQRFQNSVSVLLTTPTDSATIWYTTDSTDPLGSSTRKQFTANLSLTQSTVLKTAATRPNWTASDIITERYSKAPGPLLCVPAVDTIFNDNLSITLSVPGGFPIYYTLDGSAPVDAQYKKVPNASQYGSGPFQITTSAALVAVAVNGGVPSDTLTRFFTKNAPGTELPPPAASPSGRLFQDSVIVTLRAADTSVTVHYTLNGNLPNLASPVYKKPLVFDTTVTLQAIATKVGFLQSKVLLESYVLAPDTPWASPKGGQYFGTVNVTLGNRARKADLYYTLDGSTPSPATATPYAGTPIPLQQSATLKAIAVAGNMASAVRTETYAISARGDTVLAPGGSYQPGGGYSFYHPGESQVAARIILAPPETVVVNGIGDIPFGIVLKPAVESSPFPKLIFSKPSTEGRSLYRIGPDGRPYFVSNADSIPITEQGVYFLGLDTLPPVIRLLSQKIGAGDSTEVRFSIDDNVANIVFDLQRSDDPSRNVSQKVILTPDTVDAALKNKHGVLAPLWVAVTAGDHRNLTRFPSGTDPLYLSQQLAETRSPPLFHIGERSAYPWDLVSFPVDPDARFSFGTLIDLNQIPRFEAQGYHTASAQYGPLGREDEVVPGKGYWVASTQKFPSLKLPSVLTKPPTGSVRISLDSGWNLVGNPTPQTLYWPNPRTGTGYRDGSVKAPWSFESDLDDYQRSDSLEPWRGYFVYSFDRDTAVTLSTRPMAAGKITTASWSGGAFGISVVWGRRDLDLGIAPGAQTGFGREDEVALPSLGARNSLAALRQGRRLRADFVPFTPDAVSEWKILVHSPDAAQGEELRLASLSLPRGFEVWIVSPKRKLKHRWEAFSPGFLPAPGSDTLFVLVGPREALAKSGLLQGAREGLPGFALRVTPRGQGFFLDLDLPAEARLEARLLDLRGRTVGQLTPRWLGAGHHAFSFAADFRAAQAPGRGVYFLWLRHHGDGVPAQSVRRIQFAE